MRAEQQVALQSELLQLRAKHLEAEMRVAELERLVACQKQLIEAMLAHTTITAKDLEDSEFDVEFTVDEVTRVCDRTVKLDRDEIVPIVHFEDFEIQWPAAVSAAEASVRHEEARHILRRL
jgi:uncharacterized coiled-coil protein SlyX